MHYFHIAKAFDALHFVTLSAKELLTRLQSPATAEELSPVAGVYAVVVHDPLSDSASLRPACPVIAVEEHTDSDLVDIQLEKGQSLDGLLKCIERSPIAAATLVQLTRVNIHNSVEDALCTESLAFSALQHSQQFESWLATDKPLNTKRFASEPILVERRGSKLTLTLNRPENRNAWSTPMRDALAENLQYAMADASVLHIELQANGPAFGAGGDLTEFGSARDAGMAHIVRQTRSPARLMHLLRDRITAFLHGACVGAGIELPAFAARVYAQRDAFFALPEVSLGLIPGAGGTASILHRIGRRRFNYIALSGERIDVDTALRWRLIDDILD